MTLDHTPLAQGLADGLRAQGTPDRLATVFARVPRHRCLPRAFWGEDRAWYDRNTDPDEWLRAAYTDQPLVTQVDDGASGGMGIPSSSSSAPSIMARMLAAADLRPGQQVLEVGTGTGYNAALLTELVGADHVTTIEVDQTLADTARAALAAAGYLPTVLHGDGENPTVPASSQDRLIATCTVADVPWRWLDVVRPGGRIVTPWSPSPGGPGGVLAALDVDGDQARGRFEGSLAFMWSRSQRRPARSMPDLDARPDQVDQVTGDPREAWLDGDMAVLLSLLVPGWAHGLGFEPDTEEPHVRVASTSCASWMWLHADGRVESAGSRLLWEEFAAGLSWWRAQGAPDVTEFGLTVDRHRGTQTVWLRSPDAAVWATDRRRA
ncbi:methyltransferase domain-containing protein [Nocardiopsis sp. MT53]|uniref:Protein-L-isoaspartate O-methyltransferase n=2 Tax=Nocardiopsidaceae TaxID=83676 RepID=A0ABX8BV75_9ACTN|nr:methyltransferase domain-containing protein [Nocardiopsis changdeensis]QYX40607.1 methyltransferase domain-containing protein [Nocardiopsis sp. MT53]